MSFNISIGLVEGNEDLLLANNAEYYGEKTCCYVKDYLKYGRQNKNIEQEIFLGVMVMDFYQRISSTEDILGVDNSNVAVDGYGLAEIEGVD